MRVTKEAENQSLFVFSAASGKLTPVLEYDKVLPNYA
jgi:hypothetical protein